MECYCAECTYKNNIYKQTIPYNKELIKFPIVTVKDGSIYYPNVEHNRLIIPNYRITIILLRTLNYMFLTELDISGNDIKIIPDIFSLKILKCNNCRIKNLPKTLYQLEELECKNNFICKIPYYKYLTKLDCSNNMIDDVSHLSKLTYLTCCNNPIMSIHNKSLTFLKAKNCPILIMHKIPSLIRRSSSLINNKFIWIKENKQDIELSYILVDWNTGKHNIKLNKLSDRWQKILKFILR
jgi:hypothetical protein